MQFAGSFTALPRLLSVPLLLLAPTAYFQVVTTMDARRRDNFRRMPCLRGSNHNCVVPPGDAADVTNYILVIQSHNLITPCTPLWDLARWLTRAAAAEPFFWLEDEHQWRLDVLQEATGVSLTVRGPLCAASGRLLRPRPSPYEMPRTRAAGNPGGTAAQSAATIRRRAARPPPAARDIAMDDVSDSCSVNRGP